MFFLRFLILINSGLILHYMLLLLYIWKVGSVVLLLLYAIFQAQVQFFAFRYYFLLAWLVNLLHLIYTVPWSIRQ